MARGTTLVRLLDMLRVTAGLSLNPAHNDNDRPAQVHMLQMEQERLWADFDWPHLRIERQIPIQAGQRYYDTPEEIHVDRLETIEFFSDGAWRPLDAGIRAEHYVAFNSDLDERSWPTRRWKIHEDEDVELWPISDQNGVEATREGYLKFIGIRNLNPLVDETDRCDLDDQMLVNYVAAAILAKDGSKDAQLKLQAANTRYARLRGNMSPRQTFRLFGNDEPKRSGRIVIGSYRPAGS